MQVQKTLDSAHHWQEATESGKISNLVPVLLRNEKDDAMVCPMNHSSQDLNLLNHTVLLFSYFHLV